ncbi:MAG: Orotate phosphoribosyltransferase [Parcubacteria group bacterium GW2011_GWA2_43_11]|nr:MAG: Orotate phosphoribosyltransferase [Parcubacteria group bacterium GW2011_GWA2_43_11]
MGKLDSAVGGFFPQYVIDKYIEKDGYWIHDGNPLRPHVQLTSGKHSGGFFNSDQLLHDYHFFHIIAHKFMAILASLGYSPKEIQKAIGPAMGAIFFAHHLGGVVSHENGRLCPSGYAEKGFDSEGKKIMTFNRTKVSRGERLLLGDDVITTGGTLDLTIDAIDLVEALTTEYIFALINRSGRTHIRGRKILALYENHLPNYEPEDCLYCKMGSIALRAKEGSNWQFLHQHYPE